MQKPSISEILWRNIPSYSYDICKKYVESTDHGIKNFHR
jgi:hypothetical protein